MSDQTTNVSPAAANSEGGGEPSTSSGPDGKPPAPGSQLGTAALALLFSLLLIDAAVETFLNGAPVRWWVAGTVGTYLGLTALVLWRGGRVRDRFSWSGRASASFLVGLGLLASTAWLSEGLNNGVVMLGQPTSIVLSAATALAIAFGALTLARASFLPPWGRVALGVVAFYGVAALVLGMSDGTPYPDLLRGKSLWQRLPFWIQGAFFASFVVLPMAVLSQVVKALQAGGDSGSRRELAQRTFALLLSLSIALGGVAAPATAPTGQAVSAQAVGRAVSSRNGGDVRDPDGAVRAFYASLDATERTLSADPHDLAGLARQLGQDPRRILDFVNSSIHYQHYNGVLRGSVGTLAGSAGNSCDQAVLVRALLKESGVRSTLRVATIDSGLRARLETAALQAAAAEQISVPFWIGGALRDSIDAEFRQLTSLLPEMLPALTSGRAKMPRVESYCWTVAEVGGALTDFDPVLGKPPMERNAARVFEDVPDSLRFRLRLKVVLESRSHPGDPQTLVEVSLNTDDLLLDPVELFVAPGGGSILDRLTQASDPWQVLDQVQEFYPVIRFGGRQWGERGFDLAGNVVQPNATPLQGVEGAARGVQGLLSGGGLGNIPTSREPKAQPNAPSDFGALRLESTVELPDGSNDVAYRTLVDGTALAMRRRPAEAVLAVLQHRQILVPTFRSSEGYLARRLLGFYRQNRPLVEALARHDADALSPLLGKMVPFPFELMALMQAEDQIGDVLGRSHSATMFRGRPAVLMFKNGVSVTPTGLEQVRGIDIVETGFEALPVGGVGKILRAKMGIASSVMEAAVLGVARPRGVPLVPLFGTNDAKLAGLQLDSVQRAMLLRDLETGHAVLTFARGKVASAHGLSGWWRFDPTTGEVLAMLDSGEGGAQVEQMSMKAAVTIGAVGGATSGFLICNLQQGGNAKTCIGAAACGAVVGGVAGVIGLKVAAILAIEKMALTTAAVWGAVGGVVLDQASEFCESPRCDRSVDNDCDGDPNDSDPNDDCAECDTRHNRPDVDDNDIDGDDVDNEEDDFPNDGTEDTNSDDDKIGNNRDDDDDNDGIKDNKDAFPTDPTRHQDTDGDGMEDERDKAPNDPKVTEDVDGDGIDDQHDLDRTRAGPWITGDGGTDSTTWTPPGWAQRQ